MGLLTHSAWKIGFPFLVPNWFLLQFLGGSILSGVRPVLTLFLVSLPPMQECTCHGDVFGIFAQSGLML